MECTIFLEITSVYAIRHFIQIFCDPSIVFMALSSSDGVQNWWTRDAQLANEEGGKAYINFGKQYKNVFTIEKQTKNEICWKVEEGDEQWVGTRIRFLLEYEESMVTLRFSHEDWREETDFYAGGNFQWAHYILSLKNSCEVGRGKPYGA